MFHVPNFCCLLAVGINLKPSAFTEVFKKPLVGPATPCKQQPSQMSAPIDTSLLSTLLTILAEIIFWLLGQIQISLHTRFIVLAGGFYKAVLSICRSLCSLLSRSNSMGTRVWCSLFWWGTLANGF